MDQKSRPLTTKTLPPSDWVCGLCYPKLVIGTYGQIILHGMHFHKLSFKEAESKLRKKDEEPKEWQEKNRVPRP